MFKRRPLNQNPGQNQDPNAAQSKEQNPNQNRGDRNNAANNEGNSSGQKVIIDQAGFAQVTGGTKSPQGQSQRRNRHSRPQNSQPRDNNRGGQRSRPQGSAPAAQGGRPQQSNQQQNRGGGRNQSQRQQRPRPEPRRAPPPPPPAYIQRDVLLVLSETSTQGIELVRAKFDPLAKKIPAHVTLVLPEPAVLVGKDFLKEFSQAELPSLEQITFSSVTVHEEMYLWLVPDDESKQKISLWREALVKKMTGHSQGEEFFPHLTLGYIPRSITPEDAVTFAKTHISLPLTLPLEKLLLEEFGENQISTQVDVVSLSGGPAPANAESASTIIDPASDPSQS